MSLAAPGSDATEEAKLSFGLGVDPPIRPCEDITFMTVY